MNQIIHSLGGITIEGGARCWPTPPGMRSNQPGSDGGAALWQHRAANLSARHGNAYFAAGADKMGKIPRIFYTMSNLP